VLKQSPHELWLVQARPTLAHELGEPREPCPSPEGLSGTGPQRQRTSMNCTANASRRPANSHLSSLLLVTTGSNRAGHLAGNRAKRGQIDRAYRTGRQRLGDVCGSGDWHGFPQGTCGILDRTVQIDGESGGFGGFLDRVAKGIWDLHGGGSFIPPLIDQCQPRIESSCHPYHRNSRQNEESGNERRPSDGEPPGNGVRGAENRKEGRQTEQNEQGVPAPSGSLCPCASQFLFGRGPGERGGDLEIGILRVGRVRADGVSTLGDDGHRLGELSGGGVLINMVAVAADERRHQVPEPCHHESANDDCYHVEHVRGTELSPESPDTVCRQNDSGVITTPLLRSFPSSSAKRVPAHRWKTVAETLPIREIRHNRDAVDPQLIPGAGKFLCRS